MEIAIAILVLFILAVVVAIAWVWMRQRRTHELQERFGPEYEEAIDRAGSRREAESELKERRKRVEKLNIVDVPREEAEEFSAEWESLQARFVEAPSEAITQADALVARVMGRRGYPVADFEQRAADISVDHSQVVSEYREARAIAVANSNGEASTEDLREAMLHYRALFTELLGKRVA
jgi:hypothetical protein